MTGATVYSNWFAYFFTYFLLFNTEGKADTLNAVHNKKKWL